MLTENAVRSRLQRSKDRLPDLVKHRLTPQRMLLLHLIRQGGHLNADELYRRAKESEPRLSMSTVYRSLQLFKELGLVEEHHFDKAHSYYEAKTGVEHHHLVCLNCGRVVEFEHSLTERIKGDVGKQTGFHILGAKVLVEGLCPGCFTGKEKMT